MSDSSIKVVTLGCRANQAESDAFALRMLDQGYRAAQPNEAAAVVLVNTCVVTGMAERQSRQMIRRLGRENPEALIAVTGCGAELNKDRWAALPGVDVLVTNKDKPAFLKDPFRFLYGEAHDPGLYQDTSAFYDLPSALNIRANLMVQDGCKEMCSYCIIPYVRPNRVSTAPAEVLAMAQNLLSRGVKELIVTGINLGSYAYGLGDLMQVLNVLPGLVRLRLSSLEPKSLNPDTIRALAHCDKLCPHFHLCLQSGSDAVLLGMDRGYDTAFFEETIKTFRQAFERVGRPASFSTDLIVGFPGETDAQFQDSLAYCERMGFNKLHVFPYSVRSRTRAARFKNRVPGAVIRTRVAQALELSRQLAYRYSSNLIGGKLTILVDEIKEHRQQTPHSAFHIPRSALLIHGFTPNYLKVELPLSASHNIRVGDLLPLSIQSLSSDGMLQGVLA